MVVMWLVVVIVVCGLWLRLSFVAVVVAVVAVAVVIGVAIGVVIGVCSLWMRL